MKSLLFALLLGFGLTSTGTATAQTSTSEPTAPQTTPPAGVAVRHSGGCPVSGELNKYKIRRCRAIGVLSASQAREIRQRKRRALRQENAYLKAEAAKLRAPEEAEETDVAGR